MKSAVSPAESEFWLDTGRYANYFDEQCHPTNGSMVFNIDMVRLSSVRRAISHFVRILTRQNIPVYFNDNGANVNFAGKKIYISAKITSKYDFDIAVGQALHEAAHTLKTDFNAAKYAWTNIPHHIFQKSDNKNIRRASLEKFIHTMWNVIEDRFIDDYIFNAAPGYRGYYVALYDAFWNCPEVDLYLESDYYRYPSLESYRYRIINFTNVNTDLLALPRLDEIADIIDITNISRLKKTEDRLDTAFKVIDLVLDCVDVDPNGGSSNGSAAPTKAQFSQRGSGIAKPEDFFDFGDSVKSEEPPQNEDPDKSDTNSPSVKPDVDVSKNMVDEISDVMSGEDETPEKLKENDDAVKKISDKEVDDAVKKELKKVDERQRQFLSGEIPKEAVTSEQKDLLDMIEKHGIILVRVSANTMLAGNDTNLKVDCIVVQEMSKELVLSGQQMFPMCGAMRLGKDEPCPPEEVYDAVKKGIAIGSKLGRKLQIRNEINHIKTIRKHSGKINRRLLHQAAFDAEDLFYKIKVDDHHKATLHITVDASSSMAGEKWNKTMTAVVAICKATSMIDNIHVTVSFRTTQDTGGVSLPYVVLAYDSQKDKFSKVRTLFPYLVPNGATPEGLAFAAIMNLFEKMTPDEEDRYFLNLSDGEPCYVIHDAQTGVTLSYGGHVGVSHTKSQVDKIRRNGVHIMSYFIEESSYKLPKNLDKQLDPKKVAQMNKLLAESTLKKDFQKMYGKNAQFVNVESIVDLAKTMNRLFLTRLGEKMA